MNPAQKQEESFSPPNKWATLSLPEKQRQFKELAKSPYWHFLPEEIKERIRRLASVQDE